MAGRPILLYDIRKSSGRSVREPGTTVNYFDEFDEWEFYNRFRLDKESVRYLIDLFGEDLDSKGNFYPTSAETKILVTLRPAFLS